VRVELLRGEVCNILVCTFLCSAPDFLKDIVLYQVSETAPDCRSGNNSMKLKKRMEQWCCDTKRGKTNDMEEACLSAHLSTTKSLREKRFRQNSCIFYAKHIVPYVLRFSK
jgi:hypothetical protein